MASRPRLRIVTPHGKFVYLFLASLAHVAIVAVAGIALGDRVVTTVSALLQLAWLGVAARVFRDPDVEPREAPRAWWRMTARPTSGYVVAGLLLVGTSRLVLLGVTGPDGWEILPGVLVGIVAAAAFLRSSLLLRAGAAGRLA